MTLHGATVANKTELLAINISTVSNGIPIYVMSEQCWYVLSKNNANAPNNISTFSPNTGSGLWERTYRPTIAEFQQRTVALDDLIEVLEGEETGNLVVTSGGVAVTSGGGSSGASITSSFDKWSQPPNNAGEIWIQELSNPHRRRIWIGKPVMGASNAYTWQQLATGNILDNGNPNEFYYSPEKGRYVPIEPDYIGQVFYDNSSRKMYIAIRLGLLEQKLPWAEFMDTSIAPNNPYFVDPGAGF